MKKNRLAEITIILGIILVTLISFVGIYVQNQSNMENKINKFSYGGELGGNIEIVFTTKDEISEEKITQSKELMEKRLADIGLKEHNIYQNTENGNITIQLNDSKDVDYILNCLYPQGVFEIVDSETNEVLMDSSYVKDSYTMYQAVTRGTAIYMAIEFNEEGKNKLKEISETYVVNDEKEFKENLDSEDSIEETEKKDKKISLNLDGTTLITTGFETPITDGMIYITIGNPTTDQETLLSYTQESTKVSTIIKNGPMSLSYDINRNMYISSNIMENDLANFVYVIGIVTIFALVILIVKYRKIGLLTSVAYIGYISLYLLIIRYTDCVITFNSICGIVLTLILNYLFTVKLTKTIKSNDNIAEVTQKFIKNIKEFTMLLIPITILTVVTAFVKTELINSLGIVLFWGIVTIIIYNFIVTKNLLQARTKK